MSDVGVVVIGRNEGERLKTCIHSLVQGGLQLVYVDSGSTDGSVKFVSDMGFDVVELDLSLPFSAARARNEGYRYIVNKYPQIQYIQFVDGDCEVHPHWIDVARQRLSQSDQLASVCGRRKERYPELTIYNQLCDIEWNTPVGFAFATGGDFMCKVAALNDIGGFNDAVIAGEEPEMAFRQRQKGWRIERLDAPMTLHDANMVYWIQCLKRFERSGHAYAQGFFMHGLESVERYYMREVCSIIVWALLLPLLTIGLGFIVGWEASFLLLLYPIQCAKIFLSSAPLTLSKRIRFAYACSLVVGKFPQCKGMISFVIKTLLSKKLQIIEYKH